MTTAGETTFYPTSGIYALSPGSGYGDTIASGSDGALWYLLDGCSCIGRMTTDGSASTFSIPSGDAPMSIAAGSDGALWFTFLNNSTSNGIGQITTSGQVTIFTDPSFGSWANDRQLRYITAGPDGALWFVNYDDSGQNQCSVESITTSGSVASNYVASFCPDTFASGSGGELWFADSDSIDEMTTSGVVTATYPSTGLVPGPMALTAGPDGAMWFLSAGGAGYVGRIASDGTITTYTNPYISQPEGLTVGPDGAMWFTDYANDTIGQITPP